MANDQKYNLLFGTTGRGGKTWDVRIRKKGYSGANALKTGGANPVTISWAGSDFFWNPSVKPSTCTISFKSLTEFEYMEFFDAAFEDYQVVIVDNDTSSVVWVGYNEPGAYQEPYTDTPYPVTLRFTDGLNNLKNEEFKDGANLFTGQQHLIEVMRHCLNTIGTNYASDGQGPRNIVEIFNVYETNMTDGVAASALAQMFVDVSLYRIIKDKIEEGMSKWDVLDAVLTSIGCHIFQAGGFWYVIRAKEYKETQLTFRTFLPLEGNESNTATSSNGTISHTINSVGEAALTSSDVIMTDRSGSLIVRPKLGRAAVLYRPNKRNFDNGAVNMNSQFFEDYDVDSATSLPLFWERSALLTTSDCLAIPQNSTDRKGLKFSTSRSVPPRILRNINKSDVLKVPENVHKVSNFFIRWDGEANSGATGKYIFQTIKSVFVNVADKMAIYHRWKQWRLAGGFTTKQPFFVKITDLSTTTDHFLLSNGAWFTTGFTNPEIHTYINTDEKEHSFAFLTNTLPFTGEADIEFRMFRPFHTFFDAQSDVYSQDISLLYKVAGTKRPIEETIFIEEIDSLFTSYDIETFHGDGPEENSQCTFRLANGNKTDEWHRFAAVETLGIEEILMDDILSIKTGSPKGWAGDLTSVGDLMWPYNKFHMEATIPPATTQEFDFVPLKMTWNMALHTYTVDMDSVAEVAYSAVSIETGGLSEADEAVQVKQSGSGGGGDTPQGPSEVGNNLIKAPDFPG